MQRPYLFSLSLKLPDQEKSLEEISFDFWSIMKTLTQIDVRFAEFSITRENAEEYKFNINDLLEEKAIQEFSRTIFKLNMKDIVLNMGTDKFDKNCIVSSGFSWVVNFRFIEDDDFCLVFRLGSSYSNNIGDFNFPRSMKMEFEWVTYVSNSSSELAIPDLEKVKCEKLHNGQVYIIDKFDISGDKLKYEIAKNEAIRLMKFQTEKLYTKSKLLYNGQK